MHPDLAQFLARHLPLATETTVWREEQMPLRITTYLGSEPPPLEYVTSVRCLVRRGESVLVVRDPVDGPILPGGRREPGESLERTLARELWEETGCELADISMLGFLHFQHLSPKPEGYPYPYPDFLQIVYTATATRFVPEARSAVDRGLELLFLPASELFALPLPASQRVFLEALRARS
jgi:8-oxo-dGTP pyrophosphatase MutT (NUDIX family)